MMMCRPVQPVRRKDAPGLLMVRYSEVPLIVMTAPASPDDRAETMNRTRAILRNANGHICMGERAASIRVGHAVSTLIALREAPPLPFLFLEDDAAPTTVIGDWCAWPEDADLVYLGYAARHPKGPELLLKHRVADGWWRVRGGLLTTHAMLFVTQRAIDFWKATCLVSLERMITADAGAAESQHTINCYAPTVPSFVQWSVGKPHNYKNTREHLNMAGMADVRPEIPKGWQ